MKESSEIVAGRFIRSRVTGLPAGPVTPVFKEDWPFRNVAARQPIWRYIEISKLQDLLESSTLYLRRADKFIDPLEGKLSRQQIHNTSRTDKAFMAAYRIRDDYAEANAGQEITRGCMFACCWHINKAENPRMWKEYTPMQDAVAVVSSLAGLRQSLAGQSAQIAPISYVNADEPRILFTHTTICFYKDKSFQWERELRVLQPLGDDDGVYRDDPKDFFRRVAIDLPSLLHRVVLKPGISISAANQVRHLVTQFCSRAIVQPSRLRRI